MSNDGEAEFGLSRRRFLQVGAASGAAVGATALGGNVLAATPQSGTGGASGSAGTATPAVKAPQDVRPQSFTPPVQPLAGANQFNVGTINHFDFQALSGPVVNFNPTLFGVYPSTPAWFIAAPLEIPSESFVIGATLYGNVLSGTLGGEIVGFAPALPGFVGPSAVGSVVGTGTQSLKSVFMSINAVQPDGVRLFIGAGGADVNNVITGANYFYIPPNPGFNAISPHRVYDSRLGDGPLPNNATRTVSVANATNGTSNVVPAGASAVAYNLTIADTVGTGFLSLFPAGTPFLGNSSINWFQSNELVANGGIVALGGDRKLNVFCGGGGTTDFIIDITGFFL